MPSATPTGMSSAAAIAIRAVRDNGIAHVMIGEAIAITAIPSNATITAAVAPVRRSVATSNRRLHAAPRPVPSRSENSVTVSE